MRQSQLFTKTRKHGPKDEVAKNAQLFTRGGFIHKEMAGVYSYLPLGLRVFKRIEQIIREEMNAIGGQEMTLTALQSPAAWKKTGRWDDAAIDVWFKTELKGGGELGLGTTHEEPLTELMTEYVESYKDLPKYVYQFQTKFRNEMRAKSGIMRTREFVMKDLYSFSRSEEEFREFYEKCAAAYMKIFKRVGLGEQTFRTFASGGSFSKFSDEFQTLSDAGEDTIYIYERRHIAVNKEVYNDETLDKTGIVWPESIAPFAVHIVELSGGNKEVSAEAGELYRTLTEAGIEVLWDDRDLRAGEKFSDSDLLGIPLRVVVSEKTLSEGAFECTERKGGKTQHLSISELQTRLTHV